MHLLHKVTRLAAVSGQTPSGFRADATQYVLAPRWNAAIAAWFLSRQSTLWTELNQTNPSSS